MRLDHLLSKSELYVSSRPLFNIYFTAKAGRQVNRGKEVRKGSKKGSLWKEGQAKGEHREDALAPEPKKGVASCEKPRGAASGRRSVDTRMGEPAG